MRFILEINSWRRTLKRQWEIFFFLVGKVILPALNVPTDKVGQFVGPIPVALTFIVKLLLLLQMEWDKLEIEKQRLQKAMESGKLELEQYRLLQIWSGWSCQALLMLGLTRICGTGVTWKIKWNVCVIANLRLMPTFDEKDPNTFFSFFEHVASVRG